MIITTKQLISNSLMCTYEINRFDIKSMIVMLVNLNFDLSLQFNLPTLCPIPVFCSKGQFSFPPKIRRFKDTQLVA